MRWSWAPVHPQLRILTFSFRKKVNKERRARGPWASQDTPKALLGCSRVRVRPGRPDAADRALRILRGRQLGPLPLLSTVSWKERKPTICNAGVTRSSGCGTEAITLCGGGSTGRAGNRGQLGAGKGDQGLLRSPPPGSGKNFCYPPQPRAVETQDSRLCRKGMSFLKPTSWKKRKETPSNACVWSKVN